MAPRAQYRPVRLQVVREIWKARPMNAAIQELVMKNRRIRCDDRAVLNPDSGQRSYIVTTLA
jgi:hypothetical protein